MTLHTRAAELALQRDGGNPVVFFFQAEDGIRDADVTGVQTCALPIYGPQVMALVRRYLTQMIDEMRGLPGPDGTPGSLLDAVDLIVPHQANKTMVVELADAAGVGPERLYFDIEKVGNTSSASIPIAIQDAVREGVIDRPMRIFAPGFGAGAVAEIGRASCRERV